MKIWNGEVEFATVSSPHNAPVLVLKWSRMGGRLVSIDTVSSLSKQCFDKRGVLSKVELP